MLQMRNQLLRHGQTRKGELHHADPTSGDFSGSVMDPRVTAGEVLYLSTADDDTVYTTKHTQIHKHELARRLQEVIFTNGMRDVSVQNQSLENTRPSP